ncbi:MAG: pantetheine-phosphate adenylyltransferase [Methylophilaceae bacterium]|jgi:pantetheine-phosphate adenylyltransferase
MRALFPGSFDPITLGHEDVINRATKIFDKVIVAVAEDNNKNSLLTLEQRLELVSEIYQDNPKVETVSFSGLTVEFAQTKDANIILRSIRNTIDFESELQLAKMNQAIASSIETIFIAPSNDYQFISSTLVRQIHQLGGKMDAFVSPNVIRYLSK